MCASERPQVASAGHFNSESLIAMNLVRRNISFISYHIFFELIITAGCVSCAYGFLQSGCVATSSVPYRCTLRSSTTITPHFSPLTSCLISVITAQFRLELHIRSCFSSAGSPVTSLSGGVRGVTTYTLGAHIYKVPCFCP